MKYFKEDVALNSNVYFKTLDKEGNTLVDHSRGYMCFAPVTHSGLHDQTHTIMVLQKFDTMGYEKKEIKRWIDDLNELGFPCKVRSINQTHATFVFRIADFKWKVHLNATLMLVRCLYETGIALIPELYFNLVDADPKGDKFQFLQDAHKSKELKYFNSNHTVTSIGYGRANITKELLFERFAASKVDVLGDHSSYGKISQSEKWRAPL